jgi:uncharacterized protein (TIGR02246 family)
MRIQLMFSLLLLGSAPTPAGSDTAVREVVQKYEDARNAADAAAAASLLAADCDQLVSSGEWRRGRETVVRGAMASSNATGGKRTLTVESVRFLAPDVALADARYDLTGLAGGQERHMWSAFLLVREANGWRIAAIRNMLPAAQP